MDNDKFIGELKSKLKAIITNSYKDLKPELEKDLNTFLETSREKLERWFTLSASGDITEEELEWLIKSQLDLVTLQTLQTAGISKIRLNTLKNNIAKIIFKVIIELIIPVV
ncbi:hypothetical protein C8C83_3331 [Flavobacterium sp. 90]|uniref:hypothetical protein n=1 Tax=unclassified Flavobacterium TaxID=196869 RepID=UPI000EB43117|nr:MULTISPECIES: hypothetical protein [unclassified Flavobacterium]RKR11591.1 hypothetical protein C8C82_3642 [Flavobacterium sp. 81]TCK55372.1 hypothetical protein C8C83_3331 [Flavobacterium sp. 90]